MDKQGSKNRMGYNDFGMVLQDVRPKMLNGFKRSIGLLIYSWVLELSFMHVSTHIYVSHHLLYFSGLMQILWIGQRKRYREINLL